MVTPEIEERDGERGRLERVDPIRLVLALGGLLLAGCSLTRTQHEVERAREVGLVAGRVESSDGTDGVRVVLAGRTARGVRLAGVAELGELDERFGFVAETGPEYFVGAFLDRNGNERYDQGEPLGFANEGRPLRLAPGQRILDLTIRISAEGTFPEGVPRAIDDPSVPRYGAIRFAVGEVVTLDDPRFATEIASDAMWEPLTAVTTTGAGIYFLQAYDPAKTPVLFVHGIGGTPRDLRVLIESVDRDRFQPWLLSYPSGFRLDTIAAAVGRRIGDLHGRLGFERLVVVAHSMGGLVSRSTIQRLQQDPATRDLVGLLVTLASPLGGHDAAEWGLRFAPEPVPSWIDMAPGSEFLRKIAEPLDPPVPWYLFFGYRRERSAFMPMSSDSVVSVESELPWWAQQQARQIFGFDDDHMEILEDGTVVETLRRILSEAAGSE